MSFWETFFIICGVLGVLFWFLSLFTGLDRVHGKMTITHAAPLDAPDFMKTIEGALGVSFRRGGEVTILNNGDAFFPKLIEDIRHAKKTITIMVFIWTNDPIGNEIFDELTKKAREGVQVKILLDALGGLLCSREKMQQLEAAGGTIAIFRPLKFGLLHRFHRRNHCRAFVIDGHIGYTGGMAIARQWIGNADDGYHRRDMMVRTTGHIALGLAQAFGTQWANVTGQILSGDDYYPDLPEPTSNLRWISLVSSPSLEAHPMRKLFWVSCAGAQKAIRVRNSYFVPDAHIRNVFKEKVKEGVAVTVLVPNHKNDQKLARYAGRFFYDELLSAGVRIFEYEPTMMHSKTLEIDACWSIVGSANFDIRSSELNEENVLGIYDEHFGTVLAEDFAHDLEKAQEITLNTWRNRPLHNRILEHLSMLLAEQL